MCIYYFCPHPANDKIRRMCCCPWNNSNLYTQLQDKLESFNPSHAAIKISINATAAEFICKNIFPTPVQIKKIIKNKIGDIQQIYLYQNVCK